VRIGNVEPRRPADRAALRVCDILLIVDGLPVRRADDLIRLLVSEPLGRPTPLVLISNGRVNRVGVRARRTPGGYRLAVPELPRQARRGWFQLVLRTPPCGGAGAGVASNRNTAIATRCGGW